MIILLAVLALVVVNALKGSPWGFFTIAVDDADRASHGPVHALSAARTNCSKFRSSASCWCWPRWSPATMSANRPPWRRISRIGAHAAGLDDRRLWLRRHGRCRCGCCSRRAML